LERKATAHAKDRRYRRRRHLQTPVAGSELRSFWHEDQNRLGAMVNTTTPCQSTGAPAEQQRLPAALQVSQGCRVLSGALPRA
jgi:hypothetical protein